MVVLTSNSQALAPLKTKAKVPTSREALPEVATAAFHVFIHIHIYIDIYTHIPILTTSLPS